jgi:short-subunit dehydrogenase
MIDLNVRTLTALSVAFADSLARHKGGILNVGSIAGFLPGPGMAVYYATKAYVRSFSAALHHELKSRGVRVTTLCPGPVPTEFRARAGGARELGPDIITVGSEKVAQEGYRGLMAGRRIVVPGLLNRLITLILPLVPWSILLFVISNRQSRRDRLR